MNDIKSPFILTTRHLRRFILMDNYFVRHDSTMRLIKRLHINNHTFMASMEPHVTEIL